MKFPIVIIALVAFASCRQPGVEEKNLSQQEIIDRLLQGNDRFVTNHPIHPDQTLDRIRELKKGQHPYAVVVTCSDSRVPPELIFDQGLGDIFVIRNAGNIIGDYELGSIEYAVEHLHVPVVIVLGHQNCGAIQAFAEHKNDTVPGHIQNIIDYIKAEPEELNIADTVSNYMDMAIMANIQHGVTVLKNSQPVLANLAKKGEVSIIGALYDLENGKISLLD